MHHITTMAPASSSSRSLGEILTSPIHYLSPASSPNASDDEHAHPKGSKTEKKMKKSRTFSPFSRAARRLSNRPPPQVTISWRMETPPIMLFGDPANSAGALFTGQMFLNCEEPVEFEGFDATLYVRKQYKKPFNRDCAHCAVETIELEKWQLLQQPTTLEAGKHAYPFSALLPGHIPATLDNPVLSITYEFKAQAMAQGTVLTFTRHPQVKRSLLGADPTHQSQRVFPPTNITANMFLNRVIHPAGDHPIHLRIDGLVTNADGGIETWKLKKLSWKLEETDQTIAPACPKHAGSEANRYLRKEKRVIGEASMWDGWKSEYNDTDGLVEMEINYGVAKRFPRSLGPHTCAFPARDGTEVSHTLTIEILLIKNFSFSTQPRAGQPTSDARVLRMRHPVILTENPGMGMSWEEEVPPIYDEVPPSPPKYPIDEEPTEFELLEPPEDWLRRPSNSGTEMSTAS